MKQLSPGLLVQRWRQRAYLERCAQGLEPLGEQLLLGARESEVLGPNLSFPRSLLLLGIQSGACRGRAGRWCCTLNEGRRGLELRL